MNFSELVDHTISAVVRCLYRSLRENKRLGLDPCDHAGINKEFRYLSPFRNAQYNTFLTRQNVEGKHSSLFVGRKDSTQTSTDPTRISGIISNYLNDAKLNRDQTRVAVNTPQERTRQTCKFRSPLHIAQQILTDPEAIETRHIASFYIRLWLIQRFDVSVSMLGPEGIEASKLVGFGDLDDLYTSIGKYVAGRDNFSKASNKVQHFLVTYLAAEGMLENRIAWGSTKSGGGIEGYPEPLKSFEKLLWDQSEFRLSERLQKLPAIADIANTVFGVPIAISGLNELLNGGLKQGAGEGTVTLIRGGAGSGKTTLSISIQRAFEALGIPTIFISSEESFSAIAARRDSVLNISQKNHSAYSSDSGAHEVITTYSGKEDNEQEPGISRMVKAIADKLALKGAPTEGAAQYSRLLVVIDGVHNYLKSGEQERIRSLIEDCRDTNAHVLISSSDEWALSQGMEYFVDNFIRLRSSAIDEPMPHVERKIQLVKTRHQSSLIGDHRMQFQDEGDLSFTPNFSAILKAQSKSIALSPDRTKYSQPFSMEVVREKNAKFRRSLVDLKHYDRSVTLLYGRGSSNKTSLCLRLLCAPNVEGANLPRKILVVSFLSPDSYYQGKKRTFKDKLEATTKARIARKLLKKKPQDVTPEEMFDEIGASNSIELETLLFTPGMVTAEEVYSDILAKISYSDVSQSRYSGLLIDGLHNVFVQFPQLEGHPELWSAIMNLTRRVGIKTVFTFTDFEVWGARTLTTVDYENTRSKPLLVALSQSIDYGFGLVPMSQVGDDIDRSSQVDMFEPQDPGLFVVSSFMSHAQAAPTDYVLWDRTKEEILLG